MTLKVAGIIYGSQHIAKGVNALLKEIDKMAQKEGAPVFERPSTWITIASAIGVPAAAIYFKLRDPWDKIALIIGGYISTNLWDIISELTAPTSPATFTPAAVETVTPPASLQPSATEAPPTF